MIGSYSPYLVTLLLAVAVLASYTLLDVAGRMRGMALRSGRRRWRLLVGSLAIGNGIWAMHLIGTLACWMPVGMGYDPALTGLSLLLAVGGMGLTLGLSLLDRRFDRLLQAAILRLEEAARSREAAFEPDTVTGTVTRGSLLERMECAIVKAKREGTLLGLMFLDLDGFKTVNDSLGFAAGDELLKAFFEDLLGRVRPETLVGRLSGDEFVVLLDGFHAAEEVAGTAQSIFDRMQRSFRIQGLPLRVTASAGVAIYPQDGATADGLLKSVTLAVHEAKRKGKNSCRFFDATMEAVAGKMLEINRSLGEALEKGQFSLVFQPKFDGRTGRIKGAEALLRWFHPVLGNVSPMDFVPVAEETGQIVAISEWVIAEVCRQLNGWKSRGLPELRIAINLSPEQLEEERYAERISDMVAEAGIEASSILFEITETAAMKDPKQAGEVIREFQRAGFEFAIDDFGTGYSSLAYLQQFRAKELKIDRCFVKGMDEGSDEGTTIVSAIITLAHALQMKVVAEGVETTEQLQMLKAMGCDEVQGYLLARPLKPEDFEALVVAEARSLEAERGLAAGRRAALLSARPNSLTHLGQRAESRT